MTCHTQMIFHSRLTDEWYNVATQTYSLSIHLETQLYPNVHVISKLLLTLPGGCCPCEMSFRALPRLKTWCRATMTEDPLCLLAMFHVHQNALFRSQFSYACRGPRIHGASICSPHTAIPLSPLF